MGSDIDSVRETGNLQWERGREKGRGREGNGRRNERRSKRAGSIQKTAYKILGAV